MRDDWTSLTDEQLLAQCAVDVYRASGPGGQKRNKTSSAVRIRHSASGLVVIAEESRSQHENRAKALVRLKQAFFLKIRKVITVESLTPQALAQDEVYRVSRDASGRFNMRKKDARFWPAVGLVLDVLNAKEARVSEAAKALGTSTANLLGFLQTSPKVWEQANILRARFGHKPLHSS